MLLPVFPSSEHEYYRIDRAAQCSAVLGHISVAIRKHLPGGFA
jgi:hypothetical protein